MTDIVFYNFSIYNLLLYYVIYSFLGWCVEVAYAYKNQKKFVNRGFLNGPFCPIYGACILSIIILLSNFKSNLFNLLIIATFFTSIIEYLTGFLLEKIFKTKYWDYTDDPFNLNGRICLHFSLMWGAASVAVVRLIHPIVASLLGQIPHSLIHILFFIVLTYLLLDFHFTLKSLIDFSKIANVFQIETGLIANKYASFMQNSNLQERFQHIKYILINWKNKKF
jgi:uncharacterized membrane protein